VKRTQHSGCFIFLTELDWLNFALDTGADFNWLNTEQLYLDVWLYSNTGIEKFSWGIRIRYSTNSKVNIRSRRMRIFFRFVTSHKLIYRAMVCMATYGTMGAILVRCDVIDCLTEIFVVLLSSRCWTTQLVNVWCILRVGGGPDATYM